MRHVGKLNFAPILNESAQAIALFLKVHELFATP